MSACEAILAAIGAAWVAVNLIAFVMAPRPRTDSVPWHFKLLLLAVVVAEEAGNELPAGLDGAAIARHLAAALAEMDVEQVDLICALWAQSLERAGYFL